MGFFFASCVLAAAGASALPAAISTHYDDHNFVSAFSTRRERVALAQGVPLPGRRSDPRLSRVREAMERLEGRVWEVDPGIVRERSVLLPEAAMRADLVRVLKHEVDEAAGTAEVALEVLLLDHLANVTLVRQYGELASGGTPATADALAAKTGRNLVRRIEVHRWTRVGGRWQRDAATYQFLSL